MKQLFTEYIKYPSEKERFYILDVVYAGMQTLKDQTIYWVGEGLVLVPEDILTRGDKEDILRKLNLLEMPNIDPFTEDLAEKKELSLVQDKFEKIFELFDER